LQTLAFAMMPQGAQGLRLSLSKSAAVDLLAQLLAQETDPLTRAIGYLDDLLRHHLLQPKNHSEVEFRHQLFQEYYAAEHLLRQLDKLDDLTLKKLYLNPLDWTEALALMLGICDNERQALRVVKLALEIDLKLGARLAGAVKPQFQQKTVECVTGLDVPEWLRVDLLGGTRSDVAVSRLAQALNDENSDVRWRAAEALGKIGSQQAVKALMQALNHEDSSVRWNAASALGKINSQQAVEPLILALNQNSNVRSSTASALGKMDSQQAVELLILALNHKDSDVRRSAASALGKMDSRQAVEALILALNHEDSSVRWNAADALGEIGSQQAVEALILALNDENSSVQGSAVFALGEIGSQQAVRPLVAALGDYNSYVRRSAAEALGKIDSDQAVVSLVAALEDDAPDVRMSVADALGKIANPQPLAELWQFCRSGNRKAFDAISAIQERCRFYNYEIEQMALPSQPAVEGSGSIIIYGGEFGDFVAGNKDVKVKGDYIENQENRINPPSTSE
jgi:HEAT repeat protein